MPRTLTPIRRGALQSDIEFTAEVFKDARTYHRRGQMRTFMMTTAHQRQRSTGSVAASTLAPRAGAAGSTGPGAAASRPHTSIYSTSSQRTAIYQVHASPHALPFTASPVSI